MFRSFKLRFWLFLLLSLNFFVQAELISGPTPVYAQTTANTVSASDLINLINGMRIANGLNGLSVDASLMACAQSTADTMAQNNMSWHIGDVSGRVSAYGYNNGNRAFGTENFMTGPATLASIQAAWADADHMIPAVNPSYCHIGAGVSAPVNGRVYYVIQAAYPAGVSGCGFAASTGGNTTGGTSGTGSVVVDVSQIIANVQIATPDTSGKVYHAVQNGQSLWSIATAYGLTVEDVAAWNNIVDITSLSLGQNLRIPQADDVLITPTPEVPVLPTMSADQKFRYDVVEGDTLYSIAEKWKASLSALIQVNGLTEDTTLSLGWKLFIPVTPTVSPVPTNTLASSPTPFPTLTAAPTESVSATPAVTETSPHPRRPKASAKTYIILGLTLILLVGGGLVGVGVLYRKKR